MNTRLRRCLCLSREGRGRIVVVRKTDFFSYPKPGGATLRRCTVAPQPRCRIVTFLHRGADARFNCPSSDRCEGRVNDIGANTVIRIIRVFFHLSLGSVIGSPTRSTISRCGASPGLSYTPIHRDRCSFFPVTFHELAGRSVDIARHVYERDTR